MAFTLANPAVTAPLVGATRVEHLEEALGAADIELTTDELEQCRALWRELLGHNPKADRGPARG